MSSTRRNSRLTSTRDGEGAPGRSYGAASGRPPLWSRDFILVCLGNFSQFMTHYLLIATLSIFVLSSLGGDDVQIGLMSGAYFASSIVCRPIMGWLVDRGDERRMLLVSFAVFLVPCLGYFFIQDVGALMALRFVHGIGFGAVTTATNTVVADIVPRERRGEGIGYAAIFMTMATVLGPVCGLAIIEAWGFTLLFAFTVVAAAAGFACCLLAGLPQVGAGKPSKDARASEKLSWKGVFEPSALRIGIVAGLTSFAYSGISTFLSTYALSQDMTMVAGYFFIVYAVVAFITRPLMGRVFDRRGADASIFPSMAAFAVGLLVMALWNGAVGMIVSALFVGFGNANLFSCLQALAVESASPQRSGAAISTYFILFDCGASLGAVAMGAVADGFGYPGMYVFGALVVAASCVLYAAFRHARASCGFPHESLDFNRTSSRMMGSQPEKGLHDGDNR